MSYFTDRVFHKNHKLIRAPHELCYEYKCATNPNWVRYCVFNIVNKTVTMERCEGSYYDGDEKIDLCEDIINYIISVAPEEIILSRDATQWM